MEIGESAMEGAVRETREEANADVEVISPFAQLDIPLIGQVRTGRNFDLFSIVCFFFVDSLDYIFLP